MTPNDVKSALSSGLHKPFVVATLIAEGLPEAIAWTVVRAAAMAHLTEQLAGLAVAPVEDEAELAVAEGRRTSLAFELSVEAGELLTSLGAALAGGAILAHSGG
jgi:hypothetical protein